MGLLPSKSPRDSPVKLYNNQRPDSRGRNNALEQSKSTKFVATYKNSDSFYPPTMVQNQKPAESFNENNIALLSLLYNGKISHDRKYDNSGNIYMSQAYTLNPKLMKKKSSNLQCSPTKERNVQGKEGLSSVRRSRNVVLPGDTRANHSYM